MRATFLPTAVARLLVAGLAGTPALAAAAGLHDPGLFQGLWRSDYDDPRSGTAARPLTYAWQCPFPASPFAICPSRFVPIPGVDGPQPARAFSRSNWVGLPQDSERFWVVSANVEPALDASCNSGPPNQSEPVLRPFEGVFGVAVRPSVQTGRPWVNEVALAVDLSHRPRQLEQRPGCRPADFIPFLGFGVHKDRGGGGTPLARLGGAPESAPVLRFNYRLVDSNATLFADGDALPPRPRGQYAGLLVEAQWAGRKRMVWVDLLKTFDRPAPSAMVPWNWTVRESFYYPGAEIVFTSGPTLRAECGDAGFELPSIAPAHFAHRRPVAMRLDLQRLFECTGSLFSAPFSAQSAGVEITGLQFWVEVGVREQDGLPGLSRVDYDSRLGVAVDGIDIVARSGAASSSDRAFLASLASAWIGRDLDAAGLDAWTARAEAVGSVGAAADLLASLEVRSSALAAARLHLLAFGSALDRTAFDATLARLHGDPDPESAADALARGDAFVSATGALDDAAFVNLLFRRALGTALDLHPDAAAIAQAYGSPAEWTVALASGATQRGAVLAAMLRLVNARDLLLAEARVVVLYRTFLGLLPDAGGIGYWSTAADMPERLIEVLRHLPAFRDRPQGGS